MPCVDWQPGLTHFPQAAPHEDLDFSFFFTTSIFLPIRKNHITVIMRPLTEQELRTVLEKLTVYVGSSVKDLLTPTDSSGKPDRWVFRLAQSRVYFVRLSLANLATSIARENLLSCGTCLGESSACAYDFSKTELETNVCLLGRFTKSGKFRLHITALSVIAPIARHKLYLRPNGVMPFLYGGHAVKAHVARWSQECPEHSGVVVFDSEDMPLGFGIAAKAPAAAQRASPTEIVCFRQADCGEYLREEDSLFTA